MSKLIFVKCVFNYLNSEMILSIICICFAITNVIGSPTPLNITSCNPRTLVHGATTPANPTDRQTHRPFKDIIHKVKVQISISNQYYNKMNFQELYKEISLGNLKHRTRPQQLNSILKRKISKRDKMRKILKIIIHDIEELSFQFNRIVLEEKDKLHSIKLTMWRNTMILVLCEAQRAVAELEEQAVSVAERASQRKDQSQTTIRVRAWHVLQDSQARLSAWAGALEYLSRHSSVAPRGRNLSLG